MRKGFLAMFTALVLLCTTGCGIMNRMVEMMPDRDGEESSQRGSTPQRVEETTYYNGYMGLSVTVPDGWFLSDLNETNLTDSPAGSMDLNRMDKYDYGDGSFYMALISIENRSDSTSDNHIMFKMYAECYPYYDMEEFLDASVDLYAGLDDEGYDTVLTERDSTTIDGQRYQRLVFNVTPPNGGVDYVEEYYICAVQDLYLTAYINYWSDSPSSKIIATDMLKSCFELGETAELEDEEAEDTFKGSTYQNGYLGLTLQIPTGTYLANVNPVNMTQKAEDSADIDYLEKEYYSDDGFYIDLADFQVQSPVFDEGVARMELYAEWYGGLDTLADYVDLFEDQFTAPTRDNATALLESREQVTVNGQEYTRLQISVQTLDNVLPYIEEHYICKIKELYFVVYLAYWPDDPQSIDNAQEMMETLFYLDSDTGRML